MTREEARAACLELGRQQITLLRESGHAVYMGINGNVVWVSDMSDGHLQNAILKIRREGGEFVDDNGTKENFILPFLEAEWQRRHGGRVVSNNVLRRTERRTREYFKWIERKQKRFRLRSLSWFRD